MRGNTFTALKVGNVATVWEKGLYCGRCGERPTPDGWVVVEFADGTHTGLLPFDKVALGDNSAAKDD